MQLGHPRGGGGRDDDLEIGQPLLEDIDQLRGHVDFPDTYRVNPEHVPIRHGLLDLGTEPPETLPEPFLPVAPPPHFQKIKGRAQTERDNEQNVVEQPHLILARCRQCRTKPARLAKDFWDWFPALVQHGLTGKPERASG